MAWGKNFTKKFTYRRGGRFSTQCLDGVDFAHGQTGKLTLDIRLSLAQKIFNPKKNSKLNLNLVNNGFYDILTMTTYAHPG